MRFWLLIIVLAIITSGELHAKKVSQKIAILRFAIIGVAGEFEYLSRSIPQHLEIAIDKEENVLVIREYLWKKIYNKGELDTSTLKNVVNLGLKANLDGVVTGILQYNQNNIKLILNVVEVSKGELIFEKTVSLPKSPAIIDSIKKVVNEVSDIVNEKFPLKDPEIIKEERKRVRKVFTDVNIKKHRINIKADYIFDAGTFMRFPAEGIEYIGFISTYYSGNHDEKKERLIHKYIGNGLDIGFSYKYRFIEVGLNSGFTYCYIRGNKGKCNILNAGVDINFHFIKRNIFVLTTGFDFYNFNYTVNLLDLLFQEVSVDGKIQYFSSSIGILFKPIYFFHFGLEAAATFNTVGNIQGKNLANSRGRMGFDIGFYYIFNLNSKLALNLEFRLQENGREVEIGNGDEESQELKRNITRIGIQYRFEWDGRKRK